MSKGYWIVHSDMEQHAEYVKANRAVLARYGARSSCGGCSAGGFALRQ